MDIVSRSVKYQGLGLTLRAAPVLPRGGQANTSKHAAQAASRSTRPCLHCLNFLSREVQRREVVANARLSGYSQQPRDPNRSAKQNVAGGTIAVQNALAMGTALRNIGWLAFWSQLVFMLGAAGILATSTGLMTQAAKELSFIDFCTVIGLGSSAVSSFLAWTYIKAGRKLGQLQEVRLPGIISTVLMNGVINLVGMGSALVGLQAALGSLLSKTLTAAPGLWGVTYRPGGGPPVALDIFSVQASTCAIMAHFCGIVLGNWLLRVAHKFQSREEEAAIRDFEEQYKPSAPPLYPNRL